MKKHLTILLYTVIPAFLTISCEKEPATSTVSPKISINTEDTALPSTGGQAAIRYHIDNPAEDGTLNADSPDNWLNGFSVSETQVSFIVEANDGDAERSGTITLTYTYEGNMTTSFDVKVTQDAMQGGETPNPTINFDEQSLSFDAQGGTGELTYSVTNPVDGAEVSAVSEESWLSDFNCSKDGIITFNIEPNNNSDSRSTTITVTYAFDGGSVEKQITATQTGSDAHNYDLPYMWISSTGIVSATDGHQFIIKLSDMTIDEFGNINSHSTGYQFDLYSSKPASGNAPAAGTYNLDTYGMADPMTISAYTSFVLISGKSLSFTEGAITISYGEETISITGVLTDQNGTTHNISYSGPFDSNDEPEGDSCLTGDYTLDLSDAVVTYDYLDYIIPGWCFTIKPASGDGDGAYIELYAALNYPNDVLPEGTFYGSLNASMEGGFYPGSTVYGMPRGTQYHRYSNGGVTGESAPAVSGEITISDNGDGTHRIQFEFIDDKGYTWAGDWTGTVYEGY